MDMYYKRIVKKEGKLFHLFFFFLNLTIRKGLNHLFKHVSSRFSGISFFVLTVYFILVIFKRLLLATFEESCLCLLQVSHENTQKPQMNLSNESMRVHV